MKSDFLHRFILSMDKGEVAAFRTSEHLNGSKWQRPRAQLFETMLRMNSFDHAALLKAISDKNYHRILALEKNRMLKAAIACVMDLRRKREQDEGPWERLHEVRLLLDMGLSEEACIKAQEGIAMAEKVEDLFAELQLRELLRAVYKLLPRSKNMDRITENEYHLETVIQKVANLTRYAIICDNIGDHQRRYRVSDSRSARSELDELRTDPLMSDMKQAMSLPAQIRYTAAKALYHDSIGELTQARDGFYDCLTLWETSQDRIAYQPHFYRQSLANLIGILIRLKETTHVPILLKRMEQVPISGRRAALLAFCDVELQYQYFYLNTGQFGQVVSREDNIMSGIRNFGKLMIESKELSLLYNLGIVHLILGNERMAKVHFNRIQDKGPRSSRLDLQTLAQLFKLLLLLEDDPDDQFHYTSAITNAVIARECPSIISKTLSTTGCRAIISTSIQTAVLPA